MFNRIRNSIGRAVDFISSVDELLKDLRKIEEDFDLYAPSANRFFVFVDKLANPDEAFWSQKDGWTRFGLATILSTDESWDSPPLTESNVTSTALCLGDVPGFLAEAATRMAHSDNRAYTAEGPIVLTTTGTDASTDFRMVGGRSTYIDVRNLSVQLSVNDDGLSVYVFARGTDQVIVETWAGYQEAANVFFGDSGDGTPIEHNLEAHNTHWRNFVQAHLLVDPSCTEAVKACIGETDQTCVNMDLLKDLVIQTVAALPDPTFASKYGIEASAIKALQELATSNDPMEIRKGLVGADQLLLKAWPANDAPMELVCGIRDVTFTL